MKKMLGALAAASALAAGTAMPAVAVALNDTDNLPTVNGVTWGDFYEDEFGGGFNIDDAWTGDAEDAFDGAGYFRWYDVTAESWGGYVTCANGDISAASDSSGDYVLTCDSQTDYFAGIDTDVAARLYAEGDMMRFEYTMTNNSDAAFDLAWESDTSYGEAAEDDSVSVDHMRGFDIQWNGIAYAEGVAFGLPGSLSYPDDEGLLDIGDDYANIYSPELAATIEPGESVTVVVFLFHDMEGSSTPYPSADYESLTVWADATFADWTTDERLARGIADDVFVVNWMTEAPTVDATEEDLASTGTDITGALALGGSALVAGAVAMTVRRRRAV